MAVNVLKLSSGQREPFRKAFMSAYRSLDKIDLLLLEKMDVRFEEVVGFRDSPSPIRVGKLIDWAEEEGRLAELIQVAYQRTPGNPDLKQFLRSFNVIGSTLLPPASTPEVLGITDFVWRGPEQALELQGFFKPDPELWDVAFLNQGLRQTAAICRIEGAGRGIGTGFLIEKDLLLTNYHVLAGEHDGDPTAYVSELVLHFTHLPGEESPIESQTFKLTSNPILKLSHTRNLDYALLRVESAILDHAKIFPVDFNPHKQPSLKDSIHLLQHPGGQSMKLGLSNNGVTGVYQSDGLIQYVSRAARGSSGAPCFNNEWQVVAIHHAGKLGGSEVKCEGILLSAIYPEIAEYLV